jgi:cell volume regulation protein A
VPADSIAPGKAIWELGLPKDLLIILIARGNDFVLPSGGTVLQGGDTLLVLSGKDSFDLIQARLAAGKDVAAY